MGMFRRFLAIGICGIFVMVTVMGCARVGETIRENPKTVTGAAAGTAGGALIGGLIFRSAAGAVVGGLLGGLAGGLIGNALETKTQEYPETAGDYDYDPSQGTVVRIERVEVDPAMLNPGEKVNLIARYALLTPNPEQSVSVEEQWTIEHQGELTGNPTHTVQRQAGTWASAIPITLPDTADAGDYTVTVTIEAATSSDRATANFTVR